MSGRHYCLAKMLVEQGHEVHYFMWDLPYKMKPQQLLMHAFTSLLPRKYKHEEFTMHKVRRLPYFWPVINGWLFKRQLRSLYQELNANIIITQSYTNETEVPKDLPFIYDLADDYAGPAEVYGGFAYKLAFKLLRVRDVMRRQSQNAKAVTAVSQILYDFAKQYNEEVVLLPNGVEKGIIKKTLQAKADQRKNQHSIVYATGFGPWSRAIETLEAIETLRKEFPDIDLTLIGSGSESEKIQKFISDHNAEDYIHYMGYVYDRNKLFDLISNSEVGLNISDKNAWRDASHPMKVMDYSALGKRVVSTDLAEVRRLNFPNIFLFSDTNSDEGLVPTLRHALVDPGVYDRVSEKVLRDYNWEDLTKQLVGIAKRVKKSGTAKSVVHVASSYPPKLGGLEKVAQVLAETESKKGLMVRIITSDQDAARAIVTDAVPVNRLKSFVIANTTIIPSLLSKLLRINKNETVHLHITQAFTPEMVWLAAKLKGFSYVAHIHLDVPPSGPAGFLLKIYKPLVLGRILRQAAYVSVFTEDQKHELGKRYGVDDARVVVIPNGVEDKFYYDQERTLHSLPRLLFVGRLNYQKNLAQLLHALDGISDQFVTTLVGEGELENELKDLAKELHLQNITFAGRKEGEDLLAYYRQADVFVLPSEREGMPLVLLEAMAMRLPIVATNVTGSRDVVTDEKNGLLVPYDDAQSFREALLGITADKERYVKMSQAAFEFAKQHSWKRIAGKFIKLYKQSQRTVQVSQTVKQIKLWQIVLPLLVLANAAFAERNIAGWIVTLGFFLLIPGYLLLSSMKHGIRSRWEIASFSLGLSVLLMMVGGLLLNSLHTFGLHHPLSTPYVFATLDITTLGLLGLNKRKMVQLSPMRWSLSAESTLVGGLLALLPLLAIGGAIRLNNGASNILTMVLFALLPVLFIVLIARKSLRPIYPYAVFMMALAILLSTSLRGWSITGHDIQHEFRVFQMTSTKGFWNIGDPAGDPYNACLSITILPTMIAKLTSISAPYIYKAVFQGIFAFGLVPLYALIKRLGGAQKGLIGALIFMSFPPFLEDMPYLNRQEIAFVFFALLMLVSFMNMARKPKTILTVLCLLGVTLSHYSSGYVTLSLLALSWLFYKLLSHRRTNWQPFTLPALSLPIIAAAFLFTFLWNAQITNTTSGLRQTVSDTIVGLEGKPSSQASGVSYSLLSAPTESPVTVLSKYAGSSADQVQYIPSPNLPITKAGRVVSRVISPATLNSFLRSFSAKVLQLLLFLGAILYFFKQRSKLSAKETYFYALTLACIAVLALITLLPELSVDYSVTRLFQQTLVITALVIVTAVEFLLGFLKQYKIYAVAVFFAILFIELSGFLPQALGGYVAQLSLNNSGQYYDIYYVHNGEVLASTWLQDNHGSQTVAADDYAAIRFPNYPFEKVYLNNPVLAPSAKYLYQDYANMHQGLYGGFIDGDVIEYQYTSPIATNGNLVYVNQDSRIYHQ
jgi:glycosyltransferase involved in cell wall biosynthesis/uncharacterized membrane protein